MAILSVFPGGIPSLLLRSRRLSVTSPFFAEGSVVVAVCPLPFSCDLKDTITAGRGGMTAADYDDPSRVSMSLWFSDVCSAAELA